MFQNIVKFFSELKKVLEVSSIQLEDKHFVKSDGIFFYGQKLF